MYNHLDTHLVSEQIVCPVYKDIVIHDSTLWVPQAVERLDCESELWRVVQPDQDDWGGESCIRKLSSSSVTREQDGDTVGLDIELAELARSSQELGRFEHRYLAGVVWHC